MNDHDEMDELMEEYGSEEAIDSAIKDKQTEDAPEDVGVVTKDYPAVQREIDLHGMTGNEAMVELDHFVQRCIDQRVLTIRVITGKGLHSKNFKSILPEKTERKLGELRRAKKVFAFKREKTRGSFVVYLVS